MNKKILVSIISIIVILFIVYLSQKNSLKIAGEELVSDTNSQMTGYMAKGLNWVSSAVFAPISKEMEKGGDILEDKLDETKNVSENLGEKIKKYVSNVASSVAGKENTTCTTPTDQQ